MATRFSVDFISPTQVSIYGHGMEPSVNDSAFEIPIDVCDDETFEKALTVLSHVLRSYFAAAMGVAIPAPTVLAEVSETLKSIRSEAAHNLSDPEQARIWAKAVLVSDKKEVSRETVSKAIRILKELAAGGDEDSRSYLVRFATIVEHWSAWLSRDP